MSRVDVVVSAPVKSSFRVKQVAGLFDLPESDRSEERFSAELPGMDQPWQLGVIVGPSGSGKSVLARQAFGSAMVDALRWPRDQAVVDGFDKALDGLAITQMLGAVGFSSPPAWLRPWRVLSNGEKFRCDLARALLMDKPVVVVDEFTSVVDRQVARFASAAVARAVRRRDKGSPVRCGRFVAVTCHYDVLDWLEPDWHLDTATGRLDWGRVRRPRIDVQLHRCRQRVWPRFARHHYLSASLMPANQDALALAVSKGMVTVELARRLFPSVTLTSAASADAPAMRRRRVMLVIAGPRQKRVNLPTRIEHAILKQRGRLYA